MSTTRSARPRPKVDARLEDDPLYRRISVSVTQELDEKLKEFRIAISRGRLLSEAETIRQLLEFALEKHPRPAHAQRKPPR